MASNFNNRYNGQGYGTTSDGNVDTVDPSVDNNQQQSWQDTLAQRNAVANKYAVDPSNGLHYDTQNGQRLYFEPTETPQQYLARVAAQGHGGLTGSDQYTWNQKTGKYDNGTDWLKVALLAATAADGASIAAGAAPGAALPSTSYTAGGTFGGGLPAGGVGLAGAEGAGAAATGVGAGAGAAGAGAATLGADLGTGAGIATGGAGAATPTITGFGSSALTPAVTATGETVAPAATDLASTGITGAATLPSGAGSSLMTAGGSAGAMTGGNTIKNLLSDKGNITDLAKTIGSYGQAQANNRATAGSYMNQHDKNLLDAAQQNRAQETDALRKLFQTDYIANGGLSPMTHQLRSGISPDLGSPPPISASTQAGAAGLRDTLLKRLTPAGQIQISDPTQYTQPGTSENVANDASLGLNILNGLYSAYKTYKG